MNEVESFDKGEYPLFSAQVHLWESFIFISLAAQPQPFDTANLAATLSEKFAPWQIAKLHSAHRIEYEVQANWKLLVENYSECYHCPLVHPALAKLSHYMSGDNDMVEGPFLGGFMELNHASMSLDGSTSAAPLGGLSGEDLSRVYYYMLFPNLLLSLHPDYVMFHTLWPQAPDRTRIVCEWLFDPAVMAQPDFNPRGAVEFWDMTNRQDWHVCEITQQGVSSRVYTPGPAYIGQEDLIAAFDQEVLNALGHQSLN
jgi:Rieske 2Fe-2S family protein